MATAHHATRNTGRQHQGRNPMSNPRSLARTIDLDTRAALRKLQLDLPRG